eukprot:1402116-Amphidinium_carterae.1
MNERDYVVISASAANILVLSRATWCCLGLQSLECPWSCALVQIRCFKIIQVTNTKRQRTAKRPKKDPGGIFPDYFKLSM